MLLKIIFTLISFFIASSSVQAAASLDLKVFPPTAYLAVKPGAGITHQVKLKNEGLYTLEITPVLVDFKTDERSGQVILQQKSDFAYLNLDGDKDKWGREFVIKPGEEKVLNFVIALPSGEEFAEHHLTILFQARQLTYASASANDTLVSAVLASNVILLASPDEQNRGELVIENFSVPKMADSFVGFSFSALVRNIGINAVPITGHIKISHWPEHEAEIYQLYPDMVLAGDKRLVRAMSEAELQELSEMEGNQAVLVATGEDFAAIKADFIRQKLRSNFFYKRPFLIGAYDLELKIGDDILQKRVIVLPFSALLIALLLPPFYWLANILASALKK